jgi:hypothetical protein
MNLPAHLRTCPHCGATLQQISIPEETGWDHPFHWVCFNDDCYYYQEGWAWMFEQYEAKASYRYRVIPETGQASPIAVWSPTALKDRIVEEPA